jgi:hypothetical protein
MGDDVIINRVAESVLSTINLEDLYPEKEVVLFDLKPFLFMELILKEKDYREALKQHDWEQYAGKIVAISCSTDAIIPMWAYMLAGSYLQPVAHEVIFGSRDEAIQEVLFRNIRQIDLKSFEGKKVVVKGCGEKPVGERAYLEITLLLRPVVKSIMYGEPCSTVPVFKKPLNG